ncbi:MAG TPA: DUF1203 domain-containing protein [Acetobacteraceae bacterium]
MTAFRCVPIATETAERFRATGIDDNGNPMRRVVATGTGAPCRHCLRDGRAGEVMLLGSYNLVGPLGIYWTPSPIFLHAEPCEGYAGEGEIPEIVLRNSLVSVRSYDAQDQCIYDLGQAVEGAAVDAPLARAIADPRTKFVNIHTAKPGCLLCRVERA